MFFLNISLVNYTDFFLVPFYFFIILMICISLQKKHVKNIPEYKYFVKGIFFRLIGVSCFISIYYFYYGGGDSFAYFLGSKALGKLLLDDPIKGLHIFLNLDSPLNSWFSFNHQTGSPQWYMWKDPKTFSVSRFSSVFSIISFHSYIVTSFITACFSYIGTWKLYRLFNVYYPGNSKIFAYLIIFMPSLIFWGGGLMKDSFVLGSTCWITYNFYCIFIKRRKIFWNSVAFALNLYIIISIKPYIIISVVPGILLWLNSFYLKNIKSLIIKIFLFPFLILMIGGAGFFIFENLSSEMGVYGDIDSAVSQAVVIQEDLLRSEQYGSNNYNIGEIDGTLSGLVRVAPIAIFTALFRPLFWEIGSPTMIISAVENTFLFLFTIYILLITGPIKLLKAFYNDPFLVYCFVFSLLLAFGVGIAGTNFGALVRYRIPILPFFFPMLFVVYKKVIKKKL